MIVEYVILAILCLALMTAFVVVRAKKGASPLSLILKTGASVVFVTGALVAALNNGLVVENLLFVLGLVFAMLGDIILELKMIYEQHAKIYLNFGIALFTISAIFYSSASILLWHNMNGFLFSICGSIVIALSIMMIVFLTEKPMKLNFAQYRAQVLVYSFFVSLAAVLGLSISVFVSGYFIFSIGAFLVLISDLMLSQTYFGEPKHKTTLVVLNHITYYLGELLIMSYLFFQLF